LLSEYGFDLIAEWETVSARRLWVLIKGLPADSALWAGEEGWTRRDEMVAVLLERTDAWGRLIYMALGQDGAIDPGKFGLQVRRPDLKEEEKERDPVAEIKGFFKGLI
jgi:hypothetical protein